MFMPKHVLPIVEASSPQVQFPVNRLKHLVILIQGKKKKNDLSITVKTKEIRVHLI